MQRTYQNLRFSWAFRALALCLLLAAASCASFAAILRVQSDAPGPAHDGTTWATAYTAIQPAIDVAASGDEVWVAMGVYTGVITMKTGVALYGGFAGDETARDGRDFRANNTTIDGRKFVNNAQVRASAVTFPATANAATILDGFTVMNGSGTAVFHGQTCTGGICTDQYWLHGGGVNIAGGTPVIRNNTITNSGPVEGVPPALGAVNYKILGWRGGGVFVAAGGNPVIQANTISANLLDEFNNRSLRMDHGGGIYATTGSNPLIVDNTITGNEAVHGGGIFIEGTARILRNRILLNRAFGQVHISGHSYEPVGDGGGIYCGSNATVVGNIIAENRAIVGADGIHTPFQAGTGVLVNNTLVRNGQANLHKFSNVYFNGRLIANNIIAYNEGRVFAPASTVLSHNNVFGNGTDYDSGVLHPTDIQADPLFVDKDNGDYHLRQGSPCVDAGDDTVDAGETDLDAEPRHSGAHIDIGAYEFPAPVVFTMSDARRALTIAAGLEAMTAADAPLGAAADPNPVDLSDALAILREVVGLAPNP